MPIAHINPIPQRVTQGSKISSLTHDAIHEQFRTTINQLIDNQNALISGDSLPIGTILPYGGSSLPSGNWLWANFAAVSRITYSALFAVYGETYGPGNGSSTFNLPDFRARGPIGSNPMGGSENGSLSERVLGTTYGAETTAYTPAGNVSQASVGSITATLGAISIASLTATAGNVDATSLVATLGSISLASVTVTVDAIDTSGLTNTADLTNGAITGIGGVSVDGESCANAQTEGEALGSFIQCSSVLTVDATAIAATLTSHVTAAASPIDGTIPAPAAAVGGSIPSPSIVITGDTLPGPAVNIGGSIPSPSISVGGNIPVQSFTGTLANLAILDPKTTCNFIVKY